MKFKTKQLSNDLFSVIVLSVAILVLLTLQQWLATHISIKGHVLGDVNNDKRITLDDAARIRITIEKHSYNTQSDLNKDGKVDNNDLQLFYRYLSF